MVDASEYTEAQLGDKWVTWFFGFLFFFEGVRLFLYWGKD